MYLVLKKSRNIDSKYKYSLKNNVIELYQPPLRFRQFGWQHAEWAGQPSMEICAPGNCCQHNRILQTTEKNEKKKIFLSQNSIKFKYFLQIFLNRCGYKWFKWHMNHQHSFDTSLSGYLTFTGALPYIQCVLLFYARLNANINHRKLF